MSAMQTSFESSDLGASIHCSDGRRVMCLGVARVNPASAAWTTSILFRDLHSPVGNGELFYDEERLPSPGADPVAYGFARLGELLRALAQRPGYDEVTMFARTLLAADWTRLTEEARSVA